MLYSVNIKFPEEVKSGSGVHSTENEIGLGVHQGRKVRLGEEFIET